MVRVVPRFYYYIKSLSWSLKDRDNAMKHFYVCLAVLVTCILTACSEDEVAPEILPGSGSEIYFNDAINFSSDGGTSFLSFSTNKDWTISIANTANGTRWCTVSQTSGQAGDISVQVHVDANEGYDDRNVVLTIQVGELMKTVVVTQKQKDALTLTTDRFEVGQEGGTIYVEVKSNISYEVVIPDEHKGWISQKTTGLRMVGNILIFDIGANKSVEKREGEIYLSNEKFREKIKIYQEGEKKVILLSQNEYLVSRSGEKIQVEVNSNFNFEMKMPNIDWVHFLDSRSVSSHTLYYHVDYNPTYSRRTVEIIFCDKDDIQNADTLRIIQENGQGIYFPTENMASHEISSTTKLVKIKVNSTYDDVIEWIPQQATWIQLIDKSCTRASDISFEYEFAFYVEENTGFTDRTVNLWFERPSDKNVGIFSAVIQHGATYATDDSWDGTIGETICAGGDGTIESPYLITKCEQLAKLAKDVNDGNSYANKYFRLLANLNFNNLDYTPIGNEGKPFSGYFDGNNKSVKYLFNSRSMDAMGLFGYTDNARVENLTVWPSFVGEVYVGGVVGYAKSTIFYNCIVSGYVYSYKHAGGIIGYAVDSEVKECSCSTSIGGVWSSGGIIGWAEKTMVLNSINRASIDGYSGGYYMGGILGYSDRSIVINCYNTGTFKGGENRRIGGLVGYNAEGSRILNCYNKGGFKENGIIKKNSVIGGITGYNYGIIQNCYNSGNIEVKDIEYAVNPAIGGIVGRTYASSIISTCCFLKQHPVNSYLSLAGGSQVGGDISMCGSFNGAGELSENINCNGWSCSILSELLNQWVSSSTSSSDFRYNYWKSGMAFPEFEK